MRPSTQRKLLRTIILSSPDTMAYWLVGLLRRKQQWDRNAKHIAYAGKKGSTLKRIRIETGTRIDINRERDTIMIKGTIDKIEKAKKVIDQMIQRAFETSRPTHFISLPIVSAFATRKLTEFQSAILSPGYSCDGIDPSILVIPENLHITLGVCKLLDQAEIERAVRFLKTQGPLLVKEHLLSNKKRFPTVQLKQLRIMQSDPGKWSFYMTSCGV